MKSIDEIIRFNKYYLAKCEFVQKHFSDIKVSRYYNTTSIFNISKKYGNQTYSSLHPPLIEFSSTTINSNFTNVEFCIKYNTLYVTTYSYLEFTYDGKDELIPIFCRPKQNKIACTQRIFIRNAKPQDKIIFSSYVKKFAKNNFKDDLLKQSRSHIIKFIEKFSNYEIDKSNLDDKVKQLLIFM